LQTGGKVLKEGTASFSITVILTLKMEAVCSSNTQMPIYHTTSHCILYDTTIVTEKVSSNVNICELNSADTRPR